MTAVTLEGLFIVSALGLAVAHLWMCSPDPADDREHLRIGRAPQ